MTERSIVICGLPESGKTTFLAALWHLVTSREVPTVLGFASLKNGEWSHLNALASRWRDARVQERTFGSGHLVSINFVDQAGVPVRLTFPDLSGESFRRMWEDRESDPAVATILREGDGVLLFLHADRIQPPQWVVDVTALSRRLGLTVQPGEEIPWHPGMAPTQVKLVDLLQLLRTQPLGVGSRRLAVMLSAWDKVAPEGRTPEAFFAERLPLLNQYLSREADGWIWRVYGVSAQGGEYEPANGQVAEAVRAQIDELRTMDRPSARISLVGAGRESHDLTESIAWLMT